MDQFGLTVLAQCLHRVVTKWSGEASAIRKLEMGARKAAHWVKCTLSEHEYQNSGSLNRHSMQSLEQVS